MISDSAAETIAMMQQQHLRLAHLIADGESGGWVLIDNGGQRVADCDDRIARELIVAGRLWPTPNPDNYARGNYENEIYHFPWETIG